MDPEEEPRLAGRPPWPYFPGKSLQIQPHTPPEPFGSDFYPSRPDQYFLHEEERGDLLRQLTRMQGVLRFPPLNNSPGKEPGTSINIKKVLVGGSLVGPQVVVCTFSPEPGQRIITAVAKIYDPLYYRFYIGNGGGSGESEDRDILVDPVRAADGEYSREAAAYERLREHEKDTQGCIPKYYGSYTTTHELGTEHRPFPNMTRYQVRLIILEYIHGKSMEDLRALPDMPNKIQDSIWRKIDEDDRMAVLARYLEGNMRLQYARVDTLDNHPRNRMISPPPPTTTGVLNRSTQSQPKIGSSNYKPRVVIIDFGKSVVWSRSNNKKLLEDEEKYKSDEKPRNPLIYQWNEARIMDEFQPWVADWYFTDDLKRQDWLLKMFFSNGEGEKYSGLNEKPIPGTKLAA